jgi:hypothetical protein
LLICPRRESYSRRKKEEGRRKKEEALIAMVSAIKNILTVLAVAISHHTCGSGFVESWRCVLYHFFKDVIEIKNVKSKTIR